MIIKNKIGCLDKTAMNYDNTSEISWDCSGARSYVSILKASNCISSGGVMILIVLFI